MPHSPKKRKIDTKAETHDVIKNERQSSTSSGLTRSDGSNVRPTRRRGNLLSGLCLDMRDITKEEETGPLVNMTVIDEVLLYCGKKRR